MGRPEAKFREEELGTEFFFKKKYGIGPLNVGGGRAYRSTSGRYLDWT